MLDFDSPDNVTSNAALTTPARQLDSLPWRPPVSSDPVVERLAGLIARTLSAPLVVISGVEPGNGARIMARAGDSDLVGDYPQDVPANAPCRRVIAERRPLWIGDFRSSEWNGAVSPGRLRAYAGVPLLTAGGVALGVISVFDVEPRAWTDSERALLGDLAALAGAETDARERLRKVQTTEDSWLLALANSIPHIVWSNDAAGVHDYSNERWTEYTGQLASADNGAAWLEQIHPDDREGAALTFERCLKTGEPFEFKYRLRRHDGVYRWHLSRGMPSRNTEGRITRWFGTSTDVDDLQRLSEAHRDSERRFRDLAENIHEVFWLTDARQNIVYCSPAYEEIWGRPVDTLYRDASDFIRGIHPDDRPRMLQCLATKSSGFDIEYRVVRPDGSIRWIHDRGFPVRNESGEVIRVAGIAEDITSRREMEAGLQFQSHLLSSVQQAVIATDPEGRVLFWNRFAETLYGWTAEEANGRQIATLIYPESSQPEAVDGIAKVKAGHSVTAERQARTKDGRLLWIAIAIAPIRDAAGEVARLVGTSWDITEQRNLEEQFRQAQKMEAIGRLAGGVAHDFNNLLTVITAHADFLTESLPEGGEQRDDVEEITKAAKRAAGLTRQLLAFSRQQVLEKQVIDPNAILADLEKMLVRLIGEDIHLTVSVEPDAPLVLADAGQIEQAIMNLVVNARDAMEFGGTLRLRSRRTTVSEEQAARHVDVKPGVYAALSVADNGTGIPPEILPRLFEPFFTTKEAGRGTGLGLATVYGIVKQSEGFIELESVVGRGTTFTIYLPATSHMDGPAGESRSAKATARGTETVLVVEDDEAVRALSRRILTRYGYRVFEARNGAEALSLIADTRESIDLLLTDAVMPVVSGPDLIRAIRPKQPHLPVVIVSGYTDDELVRHGAHEARATFLNKPFSAERLLRVVRSTLDASYALRE